MLNTERLQGRRYAGLYRWRSICESYLAAQFGAYERKHGESQRVEVEHGFFPMTATIFSECVVLHDPKEPRDDEGNRNYGDA